MRKIAIFNVGGALSSYIEFDGLKILVDLGASIDFSPVDDFLIPLAEKRLFIKSGAIDNTHKYYIDQLFLSHLDNDHISDYGKFREKFHPGYMTCPNDNEKQEGIFRMVMDFFTGENRIRKLVLSDMSSRTTEAPNPYGMSHSNPLVSTIKEIKLFYIRPNLCQSNDVLKLGYTNNVSLILFFHVNDKTVLMTGDILKEGMEYLIDNNIDFKNQLNDFGVDFLIAPHHGLTTSFSERLFREIKDGKTRLNIISEKIRSADSGENRSGVDKRYYSSDYSTAENDLKQNAVKTSGGHIIIDLETAETEIKQIDDNEELIREFLI